MTANEMARILTILQTAYPSYYKSMGKEEIAKMTALWSALLAQYNYTAVLKGTMAFITNDTRGFHPSVGQIIDATNAASVNGDGKLTESEAWALVRRAASDSHYHAEERYAELPEIVRRTVGDARSLRAMSMIDQDEFETVTQSNFIKAYRVEVARAAIVNAPINSLIEAFGGPECDTPEIECADTNEAEEIAEPIEKGESFEDLPESEGDREPVHLSDDDAAYVHEKIAELRHNISRAGTWPHEKEKASDQ